MSDRSVVSQSSGDWHFISVGFFFAQLHIPNCQCFFVLEDFTTLGLHAGRIVFAFCVEIAAFQHFWHNVVVVVREKLALTGAQVVVSDF